MSELRRLLDDSDDPLAIELLHSAREEAPSARGIAETAAALGIGAAVLTSAVTGAQASGAVGAAGAGMTKASALALPLAPKLAAVALPSAVPSLSLGLAVLVKPLAVGVVSGLLVAGGIKYAVVQDQPARPAVSTSSGAGKRTNDKVSSPAFAATRSSPALPSSLAVSATSPSAGIDLSPPLTAQVARKAQERARTEAGSFSPSAALQPESASAEPADSSRVGVAVEKPPGAADAAPGEVSASSLNLEIEQLDKARRALLIQDPEAALRALSAYRTLPPSGVLDLEAQVIRIRALEKLGQRSEAEALARDFVRRYPKHRHAQALSNQFQLHAQP